MHQYLFQPHIEDLGGGYVGIGPDQAYLFIGWQRPHLAWVIDYDPWVVWVHKAYHAFFREAETPQAWFDFLHEDNKKAAIAAIRKHYAEDPDLENIVEAYKEMRLKAYWRILGIRNNMRTAKIENFIENQKQYDFVRDLVMAGRVRPMLGNLLDDTAILGISETARELDVPIRVLYLSNAENYWSYPDQYIENMLSIPFDEQSVVIRTSASKPDNGDYRYSVQPGNAFQAWLKTGEVDNVRDMIPRAEIDGPKHYPIDVYDDMPEEGTSE